MRWARTRERSAEFAEFEVVPKTIYSVKLSPSAPSPGCAQDQKSPLVCPADASGSNRRATRAMVKLDEKTRRVAQAFHWHDLRHTFASRLVMGGVDILTVKELMRHKTLVVTLRYAHLAPEHLSEALDNVSSTTRTCNKSVTTKSDARLRARDDQLSALRCWCGWSESNRQRGNPQRILSPPRMPISPQPHRAFYAANLGYHASRTNVASRRGAAEKC